MSEQEKVVKEEKKVKARKVNAKVLEQYKKRIASKEICKGVVSIVEFNKKLNCEVLIINLKGAKGVIKKEDVDLDLNISSLSNFVGREVSFIAKSINEKEGIVWCSRKEAQAMTKDVILNRLKDGEAFSAQIVNILPHGAYVEIEGVTGLLKNTDYAEDFTKIEELFAQGDRVNVKLKKVSSNELLLFEATKKYCNPSTVKAEDLAEGQIVLGVIRSIKPFGVFVNVAPYLDVLCSIDAEEYEEDKKVQILIEDIKDKEFNGATIKRYKGKIIKVL